jgi:hypothetical protein
MTMRSALPALLLLAACGGSAPPPQAPAPDAPDDGVVATEPTTDPAAGSKAQRVCDAIEALSKGGCEFLQGYDTSVAACVEDLQEAEGDPLTMAIADCFENGATCASAQSCVDEVMIADMTGGAGGEILLSASPSTMDQPIEVCGVQGELAWLTLAKCDDGTNPFKGNAETAHAARTGSMGAGGRNGSIIDLYKVPCAEKTYEVYMDMYVCD